MPFPQTGVPGDGVPLTAGVSSCVPVRGPRREPVVAVAVDAELVWVIPASAASLTAARPASPAALVHLRVQLARELAAAGDADLRAALADPDLVDAAARVVADYLEDLPDLPLVGEPFGGEEGTD